MDDNTAKKKEEIRTVSVETMRRSDARTIAGGVPAKELMYRVGKGIFEAADWKAPVGIVCGKGNNAGDGFVVALLLHEAGIPCELTGFGSLLDCLFGTGFSGEVRQPYRRVIERINESGAYVVSADINSGLNGDTGEGTVCVVSDLTVSVGSYKHGHFRGLADRAMKAKTNVDIGIAIAED